MMGYSLIISAFDDAYLLPMRIAGLTLMERLFHIARKSGIQKVIVLGAQADLCSARKGPVEFVGRFQDLPNSFPAPCIILKCGYLPDVNFLKSLTQSDEGRSSFLISQCPSLFVIDGSKANQLQRLWEKDGFEHLYEEMKQGASPEVLALGWGKVYDVRDPGKISWAENQLFKELIKETEGFMSKHFERRISLALTKRLVETSITPNQMTILSILVGLLGAFFMGISKGFWQVSGSGLFLLHSILDGCDGEIARVKFAESRWGGLLDFWGDNVVHSAVFLAIAWEWWTRVHILLPFLLAALAVSATWVSVSLIYWKTMRVKSQEGPLYTSVSSSSGKNKISQIVDLLNTRDFIYLVVILSLFGHLDWFLYASAIGTPVFAGILLGLLLRGRLQTGGKMQAEEPSGGEGK